MADDGEPTEVSLRCFLDGGIGKRRGWLIGGVVSMRLLFIWTLEVGLVGDVGERGMLMWGQICWRRRDFRCAMKDADSLDEAWELGISRNPIDFSRASRVRQGPIFSSNGTQPPHDWNSIHAAGKKFVDLLSFLDAFLRSS